MMAKTRLNLELNENVRKQLESLKDRTKADSLAEVIRRAISVYDCCTEKGNELVTVDKDGKERRIVLL